MPTSAYGRVALAGELDKLARAVQGERNNVLNNVWFKLSQLIEKGHLDRSEAEAEIMATARQVGLPDREIRATMGSAARGGASKPRENVPDPSERRQAAEILAGLPRGQSLNGHLPAVTGPLVPLEAPPPVNLPETFWAARPALERIRAAAWSRGRSAEAVLGAVLARVAADTLHSVKLPATVGAKCGLSFITALTGPPGSGKSSSKAVAVELLPAGIIKPECDDVPPGSGEGLIELLFELTTEELPDGNKRKVKKQARHNVFAYIDEGEILAKQARRDSSNTILPIMRTVFTDGTLGQANASEERKRRVPGGQYVYGIVLAIQPGKAGALFEDAGGGTPQRFLWVPTDSHVPPPGQRPRWPGRLERKPLRPATAGAYTLALAETVQRELEQNDYQRQQRGVANELDVHADLVRLKVAGILAVLDGRLDVSEADWELARQVMHVSDQTRQRALVALAQQRAQRNATRGQDAAAQELTAETIKEQTELERAGRWLNEWLRNHGGEALLSDVRRAASSRLRDHVEPAAHNLATLIAVEERPRRDGKGGDVTWLKLK